MLPCKSTSLYESPPFAAPWGFFRSPMILTASLLKT